MNNLALSEATPLGFVVYTLEGYDPEGGEVTFGLIGSENFAVDPKSGSVKVIKALDREVRTACTDYLSYLFNIIIEASDFGFNIYMLGTIPKINNIIISFN